MLTYLLMLALQVAILVAIACSLHWLFRSRPSVQYFVWLATIVSVGLAIPLQSQIPSLEMEIPVTAREPVSPVIETHVEADSRVDSKQLAQTVAIEGTPVLLQETAAPPMTPFQRLRFFRQLCFKRKPPESRSGNGSQSPTRQS